MWSLSDQFAAAGVRRGSAGRLGACVVEGGGSFCAPLLGVLESEGAIVGSSRASHGSPPRTGRSGHGAGSGWISFSPDPGQTGDWQPSLFAFVWIYLFVRLFCLLPLRLALALGRCFGSLVGSVLRIRRRVVLQNLRHVYEGTKSEVELERIASECYRQCGMMWVEVLRASGGKTNMEHVTFDPLEEIRALKAGGGPVVVVQPHLGNFDLIAYAFALQGFPLHTVMKKIGNRRLNDLVLRTREEFAITVHLRSKETYKTLLTLMEGGSWLGVLPDQRPRRGKGVEVSFLGQPARIFPGPALYALEVGARIVVGWGERLGSDPRKHHGHLRVLPVYTATGDREADVQAIMQMAVDAFEEGIRASPGQYFWFHRLWGKELGLEDQ